jgi:arylsulfatase A
VLPHLSDEVVSFLQERANQSKSGKAAPFFLYFALPSPHRPWVPDIDPTGLSPEQLYVAFVNETDREIGRVVDTLKRGGLWENTLIVFSSDNGPELRRFDVTKAGYSPAGNLRGQKSELYDGGHREPFIVTWPNRTPAGSKSDKVICLTDLYQTLATLVGDRRPPGRIGGEDSVDFSDLFLGKPMQSPGRDNLVHHSGNGGLGIRMGNWVFLDSPDGGGYGARRKDEGTTAAQLFNLSDDVGENHNLYLSQPELVAKMKARLEQILKQEAPDMKVRQPRSPVNNQEAHESGE